MYKLSEFNIYFQKGTDLFLVNSFTNSLLTIPNCDEQHLCSFLNSDNSIPLLLLEKGIFVDAKINEREIADIRYYEYTNNNNLYLVIMPTFLCNFKCKYCFEKASDISMSEDIVNGLRNFVRVRSKKTKGIFITWFGGEPLLEIETIITLMKDFSEYARQNNARLVQNIITNGYLLSCDAVSKLLKYGCNNFQVTLDGLADEHDYYRQLFVGSGTFNVILNHLRAIRDNINHKSLQIIIRINITAKLQQSLQPFISLIEEEFSKDNRFVFLWRGASDWGGSIEENIKDDLCGSGLWHKYIETLIDNQLNWHGHMKILQPFGCICGSTHKQYYVFGPDGKIFRCLSQMYANSDAAIGQLMPSGVIEYNKMFADSWRAKRTSPKCETCKIYASCYSMNCPAQHNFNYEKECPYDYDILMHILAQLTTDKKLWEVIELYP
jgi:uncharacterized protein